MRISSLIHVIGACTWETLSWYSWLRILFHKTNCLISGFPDSSMRRHADKFHQKCQIENFRHTVIKRERIGLNWFKIFNPFQWNQKHGWACWDQASHKRDSWWKKCWDNYIHAADLAYCIHPMCSLTRSHQLHNFNWKLITKTVQIVDSNKITHMIRCAWNASSMHAAFRIVPQLHSYTAPYYVRKVDCDKKFQRKEL